MVTLTLVTLGPDARLRRVSVSERREAQRLAAARERTLAAASGLGAARAGTGAGAGAGVMAAGGTGATGSGRPALRTTAARRAVLSVTQMSSPRVATCQALKPAGRSIRRCVPSGAIRSSRAFWEAT